MASRVLRAAFLRRQKAVDNCAKVRQTWWCSEWQWWWSVLTWCHSYVHGHSNPIKQGKETAQKLTPDRIIRRNCLAIRRRRSPRKVTLKKAFKVGKKWGGKRSIALHTHEQLLKSNLKDMACPFVTAIAVTGLSTRPPCQFVRVNLQKWSCKLHWLLVDSCWTIDRTLTRCGGQTGSSRSAQWATQAVRQSGNKAATIFARITCQQARRIVIFNGQSFWPLSNQSIN